MRTIEYAYDINNELSSNHAGLAHFGLVYPFFWLSLFSGNSGFETWVFAVHSCFFYCDSTCSAG